MFEIKNVEAVATITELRSRTSELLDKARASETGILIQKNNDPHAVLVSYDRYVELTEGGARNGAKKRGK